MFGAIHFAPKCPKPFPRVYTHLSARRSSDREDGRPGARVLSSSKYSVLHFYIFLYLFFGKYRSISLPVQKSRLSVRMRRQMLGGFNRGRCNEVECCTSEPPFVLDSTPGRKASLTYNYCPLTPVLRAPRAGTMLGERGGDGGNGRWRKMHRFI